MTIFGKHLSTRAVSDRGNTTTIAAPSLGLLVCEILALTALRSMHEGEPVIWVTNKDGTTTALNVDRIERVELNNASQAHESNVFLVGGGRLVVAESPDVVVEAITSAKAKIVARALAFRPDERDEITQMPGPSLWVVPPTGNLP